jgi:tetratricopeptide (TPR) repeat protein
MVHKDDWFRSGDWDQSAQELFESKLARARKTGRSQYLRLKGCALRAAGELEGARSLFGRVLSEYPDDWVQVRPTREHLADMARDAGRSDEAIALYRQVLDSEGHPLMSCTSGGAHMSLAEIYLDKGEYDAALKALEYVPMNQLGMNALIFRWNCLLAEVSLGVGERDVSRAAAARALELLDAPDQFSRHPGVGRASAEDFLVSRLRQLERGVDMPVSRRLFRPNRV